MVFHYLCCELTKYLIIKANKNFDEITLQRVESDVQMWILDYRNICVIYRTHVEMQLDIRELSWLYTNVRVRE